MLIQKCKKSIAKIGTFLPVGEALVVETDDYEVPYLICVPTMLYPSDVSHTNNAYHAMLAALNAVSDFNDTNNNIITAVAIPGFCTGVGGMDVSTAAKQMAEAYKEFYKSLRIINHELF